jgi:hypothetical protein
MENLRKKNETEMQNKMEGHSSRLEQAEDRISELEDEMVIKGKTEELLIKQLKTCEKKMQELTDSIKRPNLTETPAPVLTSFPSPFYKSHCLPRLWAAPSFPWPAWQFGPAIKPCSMDVSFLVSFL